MTDKNVKMYEGKAKILYKTNKEDVFLMRFKDDITAGNGAKHDLIQNKGALNSTISKKIFEYLHYQRGVFTHYIESPNVTEHLVKSVEIIPIEVVVRNYAAGSICRRYGLEKGYKFKTPLMEFFFKDDSLNDPLFGEDLALELGWCDRMQLRKIKEMGYNINQTMIKFWDKYNLTLVDSKVEFGVDKNGDILLADEYTLDSCRLWNEKGENLDKEIFRQEDNLEKVKSTYEYIHELIGADSIYNRRTSDVNTSV